ncbi:MAG: HPr(Ser) kinase/phosphatase [Oscillospiraceae bacterium]|jgi:HPr kinase/phosphorylase|nr:HPr(Ser) kinase/phosphatase [Oscillospiraceae bacterium]
MSGLSIKLSDILREFTFEEIFMPKDPFEIKISNKNINRMGLEMIGSLEFFNPERILIMGQSESSYISTLSSEEICKSMDALFSLNPPVLITTRGITPVGEILDMAKKHSISIVCSTEPTSDIISELVEFLNIQLAPRVTRPGGLLNVHGEGLLLVGESGVGKSETAVELLKRGHKLISDDLVEIRKISKTSLIGSAPENIRHFIEVRGIGIINARRIFGIGAVKLSEKIDMVVNLEVWKNDKMYNRMGTTMQYIEILGIKVPYITIPVRTGRNLAVIIEVAAMNNRQRKMGYNAARELFITLGMKYPGPSPEMEECVWDI